MVSKWLQKVISNWLGSYTCIESRTTARLEVLIAIFVCLARILYACFRFGGAGAGARERPSSITGRQPVSDVMKRGTSEGVVGLERASMRCRHERPCIQSCKNTGQCTGRPLAQQAWDKDTRISVLNKNPTQTYPNTMLPKRGKITLSLSGKKTRAESVLCEELPLVDRCCVPLSSVHILEYYTFDYGQSGSSFNPPTPCSCHVESEGRCHMVTHPCFTSFITRDLWLDLRVRGNYTSSHTPSAYPEDIKEITTLLASDIIVVFMGPSGSGKSHFIDTLTGQPGRHAGSSLESWTTEVRAVRLFNHASYDDRLVLVDTPGFDDTNQSDPEILEMVSKWLRRVYEKDIKLAGIIYLHQITDNRMTGSPHRNLRRFSELCGDQAVKKVVLVTTMWDKVHAFTSGKRELKTWAEDWEKDLFEYYWKVMMDHGASTARFRNSSESAWEIIDTVTKQHQEAEALLLQGEMVDLKRSLKETQVGKTLFSDFQKLLVEQRDTFLSLAQQAREQGDPQLAAKFEAELKIIQKDLDKTFNEMKNLKIPIGKRIVKLFFGGRKKSRPRSILSD